LNKVSRDSGPPDTPLYLSACFRRQAEMKAIRQEVEAYGYRVVSSWVDEGEASVRNELIADRDWRDIGKATVFVFFSEPLNCRSGGKHVEMGMAYALGLEVVLVGPRGNVFHFLPGVRQYYTWGEAKTYLWKRREHHG